MYRLLITLGLLDALLILPLVARSGGHEIAWLALEAPLLAGIFALLPARRWSSVLAWIIAAVLTFVILVGLADAIMRQSLARPLNLYLDWPLAGSLFDLLAGNLGMLAAVLTVTMVVLLAILSVPCIFRLLTWNRGGATPRRTQAAGVALLIFSTATMAGDGFGARMSLAATPALHLITHQAHAAVRTYRESKAFARLLRQRGEAPSGLGRLTGTDVILGFVESYGLSAVNDPRYAPVIRPRLRDMQARIEAEGLHMVTGTLVSPVQGGQSWLAHGTLLSGLWIDNQLRYDLMLAHRPDTLIDDFRRAGHRTVALMPAITRSWLAGRRLGYDRIYGANDIDYRGPPLNWVTMPGQFTWSFLEQDIREPGRPPLFAEVALISSHAPWTPILPVLDDWSSIGDGQVFQPWADAGVAPALLWQDAARVREHFALAIDYALAAATGYAERFVDRGTLLILLGDHHPARLTTGEDAGRSVPIHVISGDPALLEPFLHSGFRRGALPPPPNEDRRMDDFRGWFLAAFEGS